MARSVREQETHYDSRVVPNFPRITANIREFSHELEAGLQHKRVELRVSCTWLR